MPIYEYKCLKCGKEFEVFQGIMDPAVKSCQFCKGSVQKMMSLSSFHLKGNGWYATDYGGRKAPVAEKQADAKKEDKTSETEKGSAPAKAEASE